MSRPRWSEPSQCSQLGRPSVPAASVMMGSWVASTSAKIAVTRMSSMTRPPAAPSGFLRQKRASVIQTPDRDAGRAGSRSALSATGSAGIPHPGVQHPVEEVHGEVREDDDDGDEHHQVLDDGGIAPQGGLHEEAGGPGAG